MTILCLSPLITVVTRITDTFGRTRISVGLNVRKPGKAPGLKKSKALPPDCRRRAVSLLCCYLRPALRGIFPASRSCLRSRCLNRGLRNPDRAVAKEERSSAWVLAHQPIFPCLSESSGAATRRASTSFSNRASSSSFCRRTSYTFFIVFSTCSPESNQADTRTLGSAFPFVKKEPVVRNVPVNGTGKVR